MAVSISHLGYRKLSRVIFEWQAADRALLLALFILLEVSSHWLWCLFVWWRQDTYGSYVDMDVLYPLWIGLTLMVLFFSWMVSRLSPIRKDTGSLYKWQAIIVTLYSLYIAVVILVMGYSSLVAGVSLVGGAMLGMMLIRRRYVWKAFLGHITLIFLVTLIPYFGFTIPNLRQMTIASFPLDGYNYLTYNEMTMIENAISASVFQNGTLSWDSFNQLRFSYAFFWRTTHIYMALPKAIFIIYMFRTLLLILDNSKAEIMQYANQDELTQLKSRRYGLMQMQQALLAMGDKQDFSVILLDLDWFKNINDNYGHDVGDQVLFEVAQTLVKSLSEETIISRHGGEEFLIVLPDTQHDSAMTIAKQLRQDIAQHVIKSDDGADFNITASLGVYTLTHDERARIRSEYRALALEEGTQTRAEPQKNRRQEANSNKTSTHKAGSQKTHAQKRISQRRKRAATEILKAQLPSDICQRLICIADKALYEAKDRGRNQVVSANDMLAAEKDKISVLYATS
ncbi:sensor domain-containing diguanylate cyclase [Psychrobacter sp. ANT_WB68]|uniref:GGDEF domain-containing protein n=1 Tax=Psychrobacter sp. ANT_WB68 TaxID=2597355 RepID=UPI0011F25B10|nr:GGDEF domain-containing protein [Psychrobacter sp. ANT_WB68]KAA0915198.1 GGDEF domain-containing protein [Psychrobacter sp. ANT_WB68]